ncbi:major facilitator superfamily domain-containing protein [Mycena amicta]|nr:major facilitator superfamily domain-containing protein [Mycena amicta]
MKRDWRFWCIIFSLGICMVLTAMEFSSVATALPVIAQDLKGTQYIWVGSAYNLGSTVLLPFCGGLAQIFGRRTIMLLGIAIFCVGSALCGAATSMNFLIGGRTVQGLGAGAITALIQIIIADLVPLKDRGAFNGIIALAFAIGSGTGPVVGGALAQHGQWRWLFYMNLPICAAAALLVAIFLRLKTPRVPLKEKMKRLDWTGNAIIVTSTISVVIALTWAGTKYPWSSFRVLVPLILGFAGLAGFLVYEAKVPEYPIVPISLITSRTALSGYAQNFLNGVVLSTLAYWLTSYFQACKDASPIAAGVDIFGSSQSIAPSSLAAGLIIQRFSRYRQPMWFGWALIIVGAALLGHLDENSARATNYGVQILLGVGVGIIYVAAYFPVLAPIPVTQSAPALAFFVFLRNFALIWGVTIGGTIVQNRLSTNLPADFLAKFPSSGSGAEIAFEVIPRIRDLPQPLKDEVRSAFAKAFQVVWNTLAGLGGLGLLVSFGMKALPLHTAVDEEWGRAEAKAVDLAAAAEAGDREKAVDRPVS